ncbi:MAG: hypothetical protein IJU37_08585 [Desulfovibrio sp.]|nr:hypothetical protein [Desulfovibrio sp.]
MQFRVELEQARFLAQVIAWKERRIPREATVTRIASSLPPQVQGLWG